MAGECCRPAKASYPTKDPTTSQPARQRAHGSLRYRLVPLRAPCALTHQRPYASEARAGWRGRLCTTVATELAAAGDLGPGVAQPDRAIEHQPLGCRIQIRTEITLAFELHGVGGIAAGERRLDAGIGDHVQRIRIDVGSKVRRARVRFCEQRIVEPHL